MSPSVCQLSPVCLSVSILLCFPLFCPHSGPANPCWYLRLYPPVSPCLPQNMHMHIDTRVCRAVGSLYVRNDVIQTFLISTLWKPLPTSSPGPVLQGNGDGVAWCGLTDSFQLFPIDGHLLLGCFFLSTMESAVKKPCCAHLSFLSFLCG